MEQITYNVEYHSNNSGGSWWLSDEDWKKLEADGWTVEWGGKSFCNDKFGGFFGRKSVAPNTCPENKCPGHRVASAEEAENSRFLGALATSAHIEIKAYSAELAEGVAKEWWENTVGMNADERGCDCCGSPHSFWAREPKDD